LAVQTDLGLTGAATGRFFFFLALGLCLSMLISSLPAARFGHRIVIALSSATTGLGAVLIGSFSTPDLIYIGFFILGSGAGLYLPSGVTIITNLGEKEGAATRLAGHETAPALAFIFLPLLVNLFLPLISWRWMFIGAGLLHFSIGLVFLLMSPDLSLRGTPIDLRFIRRLLRNSHFWVIFIYFILLYGAVLGVYSVLPVFLVRAKDMPLEQANTIISLTRMPTFASLLLMGIMCRRFSALRIIVLVFTIGGACTVLIGITDGIPLIIMLFIQAFAMVSFPIKGYMMLSEFSNGGRSAQNSLIAIIIPFAFLFGNGVIPSLYAWLADLMLFKEGFIVYGIILTVSPLLYYAVFGRQKK
jgi:NNP family nitrate/nitrite transporter-like MFS transporter